MGGGENAARHAGVRPMRETDLPAVLEIARTGFPRAWSEKVWRDELKSPFGLYLVLAPADDLRGFVGVQRVAEEAHVMTLAVRHGSRRRGLGRALVRAALDHPFLGGIRRVHLEVRPSNAAALGLYASMGFVETGVRGNYYGEEDALLMTLHLDRGERRISIAPRAPGAPSRGDGGAPRGPRTV